MSEYSNISTWSDKAILKEIGKFIKFKRIKMRMTQDELSQKATMSRSTVSLLERGDGISLSNLIKLLRILDELHVLRNFEVIHKISPMMLAEEEQAEYMRVRKRKGETTTNYDFEW